MELRSVAVLGGGPGGLYVARLLKLRHPDCAVDLYEQSPPDQTFGFGVGLATKTQRNLEAADPASLAAIVERSFQHEMAMEVRGERVLLPVDNLIAIGRSTLLDVLRQHAEDAGVRLHYGTRVTADELDAELVIASDGVSSATREASADTFGATIDTHDSLYLWCGTDFALPTASFLPVETEHGTFVAHAYPYAPDRSTFLIETDEETWRRAGFDATTARTPYDESDVESLAYLSQAFAAELQGHPLVGNRTRWLQFRTIRCARWHHDNVVLLGDAAHTAHYSIGSGTKLAMEDGIALDAALAEAPDLETALARYEAVRRPAVEHLQETARRSMRWWDTFPDRLDVPVDQLLIAYMTRAGKVSVDRFAALAGDVVRRGLAHYAGCAVSEVPEEDRTDWILSRPLLRDDQTWPARSVTLEQLGSHVDLTVDVHDPWGGDGDVQVKQATAQSGDASRSVLLRSADDLGAVLTMFDLGERLRREAGVVVAATVPAPLVEFAVAALASGRIDLVVPMPASA
ncbi:FAD-dependent monooxygenase [Nocardioides currus]|uniref:Oxidoreductase n=1 Tax=Nocardioides currus TaxID=2133958 RepID=A0A2R7YXK2_9ACTN|nr:FAD-dependent monooxygenase [Nocardioides currus]PUA81083.1 oxidoreductase [Nocardioides currus]